MGNHVRGRNRSGKGASEQQAGIRERARDLLRVAVALVIMGGVPIGGLTLEGVDEGLAQTSGSGSLAEFKSGQVTDKKGNRIEIDKKDYVLKSDVTVRDDEGKKRELSEVAPGSMVQFHLKQGRIDQLVLVLPK
ncbi:MAG: hypothetical protein ACREIO_07385 [Nitrospiraceae bacterium]